MKEKTMNARQLAYRGTTTVVLGLLAVGQLIGAAEPPPPAKTATPMVLTEKTERESYWMGVNMARNFKRQGLDLDLKLVVKGMHDVLAGSPLLMSEKELRETMSAFQLELRKRQVLRTRVAAVDNKQAGDAFLAANGKLDGVVTLANGLQYKVITPGTGRKPTATDTVECRYRGTHLDGTEFDSTDPAGPPAIVKLATPGVIAGWKEALKLMPVGAKWQLFVPAPLAYGQRGVGSDIGPNETLLFEMELVRIK